MAKFGVTKAYRYYADRFYMDRANRDVYLYRDSNGELKLSGYKDIKLIRKTADEVLNNDNTLQNDDELIVPVLANEVYFFIASVRFKSATAADFKMGWSVPSGTTMYWHSQALWYGVGVGSSPGAGMVETDSYARGGGGVTVETGFMVFGMIHVGATAGNVVLQWAQNTADSSDITVMANSCITAFRLT